MFRYEDLVKFERSVRHRTLLSVYINGEVSDPADRHRWRLDLRHSLDDVETWLEGSSHGEREAFRRCRERVMADVDSFEVTLGSPGWVAFFAPDGALHSGPLPAVVPTVAAWGTGAFVTPYIRAIKEAQPVIVALVDARTARVFRYAERSADLVETLTARAVVREASHMSSPPRQGFHMGTRGTPGADAIQQERREATDVMLADLAKRVAVLAGDAGSVAIGGIDTVAKAALSALPADLAGRAARCELDVHASPAQVAEAARTAASSLRNAADLARVDEALTGAVRNGRGVTGSLDTLRALEEKRVRDLVLTSEFLRDHAADAARAVRLAFDSGSTVEHVSGQAAERLDTVGGIAARLWYAGVPSVGRE
jgi:hypothetical protein